MMSAPAAAASLRCRPHRRSRTPSGSGSPPTRCSCALSELAPPPRSRCTPHGRPRPPPLLSARRGAAGPVAPPRWVCAARPGGGHRRRVRARGPPPRVGHRPLLRARRRRHRHGALPNLHPPRASRRGPRCAVAHRRAGAAARRHPPCRGRVGPRRLGRSPRRPGRRDRPRRRRVLWAGARQRTGRRRVAGRRG
ncbi:hypothetical protein BU14_2929s0001, partial [Porphyra umbilicalis]